VAFAVVGFDVEVEVEVEALAGAAFVAKAGVANRAITAAEASSVFIWILLMGTAPILSRISGGYPPD
jgi:hypothetical protein